MYRRFGKRILDLSLVVPGLVVLAPLFCVLALSVRLSMGRPVLFRQRRPGIGGRPFTLYKFRTMTEERDGGGRLLDNTARLTTLGRLLRSSSLDELPELFNVLKGDMSLVGPRPLLTRYLDLYSPEQQRRHELKPGITGWAQINGRNSISWGEKFEYDVWYVDHLSVALDLRILWRTLVKVLKREDINAGESVTMPPFDGTN